MDREAEKEEQGREREGEREKVRERKKGGRAGYSHAREKLQKQQEEPEEKSARNPKWKYVQNKKNNVILPMKFFTISYRCR